MPTGRSDDEPNDSATNSVLDDVSNPSTAAEGDGTAASTALQTHFWLLVLVFNFALLGLSVGAMFLLFENDWTLGSQLFVGGAILLVYGVYRYRQVKRRLDAEELAGDGYGE